MERIFKNIILKENEEIAKVVRQHWLSFLGPICLAVILIILPFFFLFPLIHLGQWGIIGFFIVLVIGVFYGLRKIIVWYYDVFIITNQRLVDIYQKGFFSRKISEAVFDKTSDVSYKKKGIRQTLFNYGDIQVSLRESSVPLILKNISRPQRVRELIVELQEKFNGVESAREQEGGQEEGSDGNGPSQNQELIDLLKKVKEKVGEDEFKKVVEKL